MNALLLALAVAHQHYAAAFMVMPQAAPSLASGETATSTSTSNLVGRGGLHVAIDVSSESESSRVVSQCVSGLPCGESRVCVAAMARSRAASTRRRSRLGVAPPEASGDGDYSREEEQPEDVTDVDVEGLMSSLESSDLFGGGGGAGGEGERGGVGGGSQ
ncbi:unnamed protein product [Ectocarpus sp. 6 AP-2014]